MQRRLSNTPAKRRCLPPDFGKKMIRAAHAKEKQLLEKSRNRPNRLNLLDSTVCSITRSNFFTKNSCLVSFRCSEAQARRYRRSGLEISAEILVALQEIFLNNSRDVGC